MRECCICGKEIIFGFNYLCKEHWDTYKGSIDEPWLRYLMSYEQKERSYRKDSSNNIPIEDIENNE
jgi:hypothetical protein